MGQAGEKVLYVEIQGGVKHACRMTAVFSLFNSLQTDRPTGGWLLNQTLSFARVGESVVVCVCGWGGGYGAAHNNATTLASAKPSPVGMCFPSLIQQQQHRWSSKQLSTSFDGNSNCHRGDTYIHTHTHVFTK